MADHAPVSFQVYSVLQIELQNTNLQSMNFLYSHATQGVCVWTHLKSVHTSYNVR